VHGYAGCSLTLSWQPAYLSQHDASCPGRKSVRGTGFNVTTGLSLAARDPAKPAPGRLLSGPRHPPKNWRGRMVLASRAPAQAASPQSVSLAHADPARRFVQVLTRGQRPASVESCTRIRERAAAGGFARQSRAGRHDPIGTAASPHAQRPACRLDSAEPGVHIDLAARASRETSNDLRCRGAGRAIAVSELAGLLAGPSGRVTCWAATGAPSSAARRARCTQPAQGYSRQVPHREMTPAWHLRGRPNLPCHHVRRAGQ